MAKILDEVMKALPKDADISEAVFEGSNIVLYTKNKEFLLDNQGIIRNIVDNLKKRIELRADPSTLMGIEDTKIVIKKILPEEAGELELIFDPQRSRLIIESEKPGLAIGRGGDLLKEIKKQTLWTPIVRRIPPIRSQLIENIRQVLYDFSDYRKKFLNKVGKRIYEGWTRTKRDEWVRITALGSAREVGRSCFLLSTPESRIMLDCGFNVAAPRDYAFPYLDVPEFNINDLDAVILSHPHIDHCGSLPYLFKMGYRGPVYCTAPTRDVAALLCLDMIDIAVKEGNDPMYNTNDVKEMVKHTICLDYEEVSDITPDVRITLYNAGHNLGSSLVHMHIGNGLTNFLYSLDGSTKVTVIDENNNPQFIEIGEFIDNLFDKKEGMIIDNGFAQELLNTKGFGTIAFNKKTLKSEIVNITSFVRHPINEDLYEIKTESGRSIKVTKSHSIFTASNGKVISSEVSKLKEGDFIIGAKKLPSIYREPVIDLLPYLGDMRISIEDDNLINHFIQQHDFSKLINIDQKIAKMILFDYYKGNLKYETAKKYKIHPRRVRRILNVFNLKDQAMVSHPLPNTIKISRDFARFLGYYISEGHPHNKDQVIVVTNNNYEILEDCYNIIKKEFGIEGTIRFNEGDKCITFSSKQLKYLISNILKCGKNAYEKRVPKELLLCHKDIMSDLMYGLFSGDGGIRNRKKGREINYGSKSKGLIEDINFMLLQFDLVPTLVYNKSSEMYNLHIFNSEKILEFLEEININNSQRDLLVQSLNLKRPKASFDMRMPFVALSDDLQKTISKTAWQCAESATITKLDNWKLSEDDIKLIESDLLFDKIKSIVKVKPTSNYVYDFRVQGFENFLGGDGFLFMHNSGDYNYETSNLLGAAATKFPRLESVMMEATYGTSKDDTPTRKESEEELIKIINKVAQQKGKVLMPVLGVGRSQECMLILERAMHEGKIPQMPIYVQGMVWDVNAIHTAYPDFLNARIKKDIFMKDHNAFLSNIFKRVVSQKEMGEIKESKGPFIVMATSGMLQGGPSLEYFKAFAENPKNALVMTCYQGAGSYGRRIEEGEKEINFSSNSKKQDIVKVLMPIYSLRGFSVPYETPVMVYRDGIYELEKIGNIADENIGLNDEGIAELSNVHVASFDNLGKIKMHKASHVIKHKVMNKHLIIKTKSGKSVQVSKGHSLFTLKNNKIVAIESDKLSKNDFIVIPRKLPESHTVNEVIFNNIIPEMYSKFNVNNEEFYKPKKGTVTRGYLKYKTNDMKSFARFLGYYLAEGHLDERKIGLSFGSHEKDTLVADAVKCSKSCFGIEPYVHKIHNTEIQVIINNKLLTEYFKTLKIGNNATNKVVPNIVFNFDQEKQKEFLDGYFKGDGYDYKNGSKGYLAAKSASKDLLHGISYVLLQNSIISRIKGPFKVKGRMLKNKFIKDTIEYKLYIGEKNFKKIKHKGYPPFSIPLKDIDFYGLYKNITNVKLKRLSASSASISKRKLNAGISIEILKDVIENLDYSKLDSNLLELIETLKCFVYGDIALDIITNIDETDCKNFEYDLSVPGLENFCGGYGGVMLHNSGHSSFKQLCAWVENLEPRPKKLLLVHGDYSRCIEMASVIYQRYRIETVAPKNLETIRLR